MLNAVRLILAVSVLIGAMSNINAQTVEMKKVNGGEFVPLYGADSSIVYVKDFFLDVYPVTQQDFMVFTDANPKWMKSEVIALFADDNYLYKWKSDHELKDDIDPNSAVTNVSWYAAKEYCAWQGKRLPTMDEWEYAAMADETKQNAQTDSLFSQRILAGYETPKTHLKPVGSTFKNYWGIYDMHGLVWEWTSDFNSVLISGESRQDVDTERKLFCAGGSVSATDLMNYAAFMRYALRGSIKANYCLQNLGFRCASSKNPDQL